MNLLERRALDTRSPTYRQTNGEQVLASDLVSLSFETDTQKPANERITVLNYRQAPDGRIVSPLLGDRDIRLMFSDKGEVERLETMAANAMLNQLLYQRDGTISVWISPPGGPYGYDRGSLVVGFNKTVGGVKEIKKYAFPHYFTAQQCLSFARNIAEFSWEHHMLQDTEDLRNQAIGLRCSEILNPFAYVQAVIPLPLVWEKIENGEAEANYQEALAQSMAVSQEIRPHILASQTEHEYLAAGAYGERLMRDMGLGLSSSGGCGMLNSDLLGGWNFGTYRLAAFTLDEHGWAQGYSSEQGKYVKNCGMCGRKIEEVISRGYKCLCGGVYEGC